MTYAPSAVKSLKKKVKKGFKGYPLVTIAFYGPDNKRASKITLGIVTREGAEPEIMKRWSCEAGDIRANEGLNKDVLNFIKENSIKTVAMTDGIIGCPHEEGVDYPEDGHCSMCPFWKNRDRWTGEIIQ